MWKPLNELYPRDHFPISLNIDITAKEILWKWIAEKANWEEFAIDVNLRLSWYLETKDLLTENEVCCRRKRSDIDGCFENDVSKAFYNREHLVSKMF